MTIKTTLHMLAIKALINDMVHALGAIEAVYPITNIELSHAIKEANDVLDEYSYTFFNKDSVAITSELEESEDNQV